MFFAGPAWASIPHGGTLLPKQPANLLTGCISSNTALVSRSRLGSAGPGNTLPHQSDQRHYPRTVTTPYASTSQPGPQEDSRATPRPQCGAHHVHRPADPSTPGSVPSGSSSWPVGNCSAASSVAGGLAAPGQGPVTSPRFEDGQSDGPSARILVAAADPSDSLTASRRGEEPPDDAERHGAQQGSAAEPASAGSAPVEPLLPPPQRPGASNPMAPGQPTRPPQQEHQQQHTEGKPTDPPGLQEPKPERQQPSAADLPASGAGNHLARPPKEEPSCAREVDPPAPPRGPTGHTPGPGSGKLESAAAHTHDQHQPALGSPGREDGLQHAGGPPSAQQPCTPVAASGPGAEGLTGAFGSPEEQRSKEEGENEESGSRARPLNGHDPLLSGSGGPRLRSPDEQLPPLRLDFLDTTKWLQDWVPGTTGISGPTGSTGSQGPTGQRPSSRPGSTGSRRRQGGAGGAKAPAQSLDERIRQLVYAASTLIQLRAVCERHLPYMSAVTAAVALSRLTTLTAATQRLHRAQMRPAATAAAAAAKALSVAARQGQGQRGTEVSPAGGTSGAVAGAAAAVTAVPAASGDALTSGRDEGAGVRRLSGADKAPASTASATDSASSLLPSALPTSDSSTDPVPKASSQGPQDCRQVAASDGTPAAADAALAAAALPAAATTQQRDAAGASPSDLVDTVPDSPLLPPSAGAPSPSASSSSSRSSAAAGSPLGSGAALSVTSRDQAGSVRLMRRLLRHIAFCMAAGSSASGSGRGSRGSGAAPSAAPLSPGAVAAAAAPRHHSPPDHRARTAGTVLVTLARAGWRPSAEDVRALYDILDAARPDLFRASPLQLARLATALPALRLQPSAAWLDHFAAVSRSKMYSAAPGQLAAFAWCLAKLRYNPGELWLYSLTDHLLRDRKIFGASASHLCQLLWALHQTGFTPDPDWRAACSQAVEAAAIGAAGGGGAAGATAKALTPAAAAAAGTARATRRGRRGGAAAAAPAATPGSDSDGEGDEMGGLGAGGDAGEEAGNAPGHVASLLLWSVRTGTAPTTAALDICLDRLLPHLRYLRRGQLLRLLLALSEGGHRASEGFLGRVLHCLQPKLPQLHATHQLQVLLAVSQLKFVPSQPWLRAFLEASRSQLRNYTPSHVTAIYQVFAGWQLRPPRPYLDDMHAYTDNLLTKFPPRSLAMMLHSMCSLGVKPPRRWLANALEKLAEAAASVVVAARAADVAATNLADTADAAVPMTGIGAVASGSSAGGHFAEYVTVPAQSAAAPPTAGQRRQLLRQQQRLTTAAALVTTVCSLRGIVELEDERGRSSAGAAATGQLVPAVAVPTASESPPPADALAAADTAAAPQEPPPPALPALLPYELWAGLKALLDVCRDSYMDVLTGPDLFKLIKALTVVNFYPGRDFLAAHSLVTARAGAHLSPADKEEVAACYGRLAALAPVVAAEARRQAELRRARVSVLVRDPWAA